MQVNYSAWKMSKGIMYNGDKNLKFKNNIKSQGINQFPL